jgi:CubicO group peptidase (beta-lactamase class C family)
MQQCKIFARILTIVAVLAIAKQAPGLRAEDIGSRTDNVVQDHVQRKIFTGSILVARDGKILFDKSYGHANLERDILNSPTTKFRIASLAKQFTAASIFLLQERGKLNIDDPVKKYVPDAPAAWDKITIYNLLTHSWGIPNSYDGITSWSQTKTPEELVAAFRNKPLDFEPGKTPKYSNAGYYLLGYLIEKVSGQSYKQFVSENIFKLLDMMDSGYVSNSEAIRHRASGYQMGPAGPENARYYNETLLFSSGGLYSTTEDLLKWERGLFAGKLLSATSLKRMTAPFEHDFACGLLVPEIDGHTSIEHAGDMDGFTADMVYYVDDKVAVIVLNNLSGETRSIASKLGAVTHGEKVIVIGERKEVKVPSDSLTKYVGTYVDIIPGYDVAITLEGDHLIAQISDDSKRPLFAESDTIFFDRESEGEYQFVRTEGGEVAAALYTQSGHKMKGLKK